jgi:hypothetical protein
MPNLLRCRTPFKSPLIPQTEGGMRFAFPPSGYLNTRSLPSFGKGGQGAFVMAGVEGKGLMGFLGA